MPHPTLRCPAGGQVWSILFGFGRICSEWLGWVSGCALSGRVDFAWSGLVDSVRFWSGLVGAASSLVIPAPEWESAPSRIRRFAVRQVVRFGRVCSVLVGVFSVGFGLCPIWSGWILRGQVWSILFRFGRVWSGQPPLSSFPSPSGNCPAPPPTLRCPAGGQVWSGLFGFVRGVRGGFRAAPYLVGVDFAWSGLVDSVRICSGLFRFVRAWSGCAVAVR